jgi:ribosomal protein S18 acetylase RimI-like enzyme
LEHLHTSEVTKIPQSEIRLVRVYSTEMGALRDYIEALYRHDEDFDSMKNIEAGVLSLMRNEALATAFFIERGEERIGYVILTRYHSVEKGGLTIYIDELYVEDRFRRCGVGKNIMREIQTIARGQGAVHLWAQTEPYNDAAQQFFVSLGFKGNPNRNFELPL